MTDKEKAKAYDEALERAKDGLTDKRFCETEDTISSVVKYIFPQLSESEDERIREEMIRYFTEMKKGGSAALPYDDCIAYLERQKEQKLTDTEWAELQSEFKNINEAFEDGKKEVIDNPEKYGLQKENKFAPRVLPCSAAWFEDDDEEQKEQKPAEWSEEDRRIIDRACVTLRAYANGELPDILPSEILECVDKLKSICQQPKPEWSEEDEKILNELLDHCNTENATWYNWLKSLRPQLKQNDVITPNKEFFQWIYDRLVNVHNEDPNVDYMISFKKRIEELSFDEPSWNPSEEQPKMNIPSAGSGAMGTTPPKFKLDVKPVQPEVDLEKEIDDYIAFNFSEAADGILISDANSTELQITDVSQIARHFYELGKLNVRKKE